MSSSAPRLLCLGLGYTAEVLARRLAARGFTIVGTTRDIARKRASLGPDTDDWQLIEWDGSAPLPADALAESTHLLHSIMPDAEGDPILHWHAEALAVSPKIWTGYLSTTGVYGDHQGAWVDETTVPRPSKDRTRRRLAAEQTWQQFGAHVFRLAGIYGPGRSALERVERGDTPIAKPGKLFNRIHVDDIATVLEASIARPQPSRVYDVADARPASQVDVLGYAAELLGLAPLPAVPFEQAELSPIARSFWDDDVRIAARRLRAELGVSLAHPDYRSGLRACLAARQY